MLPLTDRVAAILRDAHQATVESLAWATGAIPLHVFQACQRDARFELHIPASRCVALTIIKEAPRVK